VMMPAASAAAMMTLVVAVAPPHALVLSVSHDCLSPTPVCGGCDPADSFIPAQAERSNGVACRPGDSRVGLLRRISDVQCVDRNIPSAANPAAAALVVTPCASLSLMRRKPDARPTGSFAGSNSAIPLPFNPSQFGPPSASPSISLRA
jgi:hypothetical protein